MKRLTPVLLALAFFSSPLLSDETKSLYDRLGGQDAIKAVVDQLVTNITQDKRIVSYFEKVDLDHLKQMLVEQICQATGGPCQYTGRDMKTAHQGLGVTHEAFGALVEDLVKALNTFKVPAAEQKELLGLLAPMEPDIVEKKQAAASGSLYAKLGETQGIHGLVN